MKCALIYPIVFVLAYFFTFPLNFKDATGLAQNTISTTLFQLQFDKYKKKASFLVKHPSVLLANDKENSKNVYQLTAEAAIAGTISVSPERVVDNDVAGGAAGIDRSITITNTGSGVLSVSAINITGSNPGEFVLSGLPAIPVTINEGDSMSFSIAFNPSSTGLKTASISINSDDAANPVVSIPLRGFGTSGLGG